MPKQKPYRITSISPSFKSTHQELWRYIQLLHQKIIIGNAVLGGYEHKLNVKEIQLCELKNKIKELEIEKYPPMDKIKDLPLVELEDLPFLSEEN